MPDANETAPYAYAVLVPVSNVSGKPVYARGLAKECPQISITAASVSERKHLLLFRLGYMPLKEGVLCNYIVFNGW